MSMQLYRVNLDKNYFSDLNISSIVWGNYESISINSLENLSGFFDSNSNNSNITNSIYIYNNNYNSVLKLNTKFKIFCSLNDSKDQNNDKYILISLFKCSFDFINKYYDSEKNYDTVYNYIKNALRGNNVTGKEKKTEGFEDSNAEVFKVLGNNDFCMIKCSQTIKECIEFVERIQKFKCNEEYIFDSSYSVITFGSCWHSCNEEEKKKYFKTETDDVEINIQLTYICKNDSNSVLKDIFDYIDGKNRNYYSSLGEYDLVINESLKKLNAKIYDKNGPLYPDKAFQKVFHQCNTRLSIKKSLNIKDEKQIETEEKTETEENAETETLEFPQGYIFEQLKIGYQKCVKNKIWNNDLKYQLESVVKKINELKSSEYEALVNKDKYTQELINVFIETQYHVAQSLSFNQEPPLLNLKATGQYDRMYRFYYSVIKGLLLLVYSFKCKEQSELIPLVSIGYDKIPKSRIFFDVQPQNYDTKNEIKNNFHKKILKLNLPINIWDNIPYYAPLLIHEIGHYICPDNRVIRNKRIAAILYGYTTYYLLRSFSEKNNIRNEHLFSDELLKCIKKIDFDKIMKFSVNIINVDADEKNNFYKYKYVFKNFKLYICEKIFYNFYKKTESENYIKRILESYLSESGISEKSRKEFFNKFFEYLSKDQNLIDNLKKHFENIISGIRESCADKFMTAICKMNFSIYLAYIINSLCVQNITDDNNNLSIRTGMVLDYFNKDKINEDYSKVLYIDSDIKDSVKKYYEKIGGDESCFEANFKQICGEIDNQYNGVYNMLRPYLAEVLYEYNEIDVSSIIDKLKATYKKSEFVKYYINFIITLFRDINIFLTSSDLEADSPKSYNDLLWLNKIDICSTLLNLKDIEQFWDTVKKITEDTKHGAGDSSQKDTRCNDEDIKDNDQNIFKKLDSNSSFIINTILQMEHSIKDDLEFFKKISTIHKILGGEDAKLWYRGHKSSKWNLIPILYRDKEKGKYNLYKNFLNSYEFFVASSYGNGILSTQNMNEADWIACMQHYLVHTHFLDWSESPIIALYFALENYFDDHCRYLKNDFLLKECTAEGKQELKDEAEIIILNPQRLNKAFHSKLNEETGDIPNLSIEHNKTIFNNYVLARGEKAWHPSLETEKFFKECIESENTESNCLPLAITTSESNARLKAQKGHFVAFDLMFHKGNKGNSTYKELDQKKLADYFDLKILQDKYYQYLKDKKRENEFEQFLAVLKIDKTAEKEIVKLVKYLGINISTIYPELFNLGKVIQNQNNN